MDGGKLLLYGGLGPQGVLGDTWIFDTTAKTWTKVNSTANPPAMQWPVMDYVPAIGKVLLIDNNPNGAHTWEFDAVALQWTDAGIPGGPVLTQSTPWSNMGAFDPHTGQFVLFLEYDYGNVQIWALSSPSFVSNAGPAVSLSSASLTFNSTQRVKITNTGSSSLMIGSLSITGSGASAFTQSDNCQSTTLDPGAYCTITVSFFAPSPGNYSATLSISDDAPNSPQTVSLNGTF